MTLASIWGIAQILSTIAGLIGLLKEVYKRIIGNSEKKTPVTKEKTLLRPQDPVPGRLENGNWVFICGEKKYDISKSAYIWGTGSGLSVMDSSHREEKESIKDFPVPVTRVPDLLPRYEVYQTKESKTFFLIRIGCFVGEYSKEEVREWLNAHGAPRKAYERAGIELRAA